MKNVILENIISLLLNLIISRSNYYRRKYITLISIQIYVVKGPYYVEFGENLSLAYVYITMVFSKLPPAIIVTTLAIIVI